MAWFGRLVSIHFPTREQSGSVLGILKLWRKKYIIVTTFAQFGNVCALASTTNFKSVAALIMTPFIRRFSLINTPSLIDCSGTIYQRTPKASTLLQSSRTESYATGSMTST